MLEAVLVVLLLAQAAERVVLLRRLSAERERLARMAFAEDKSERIAALLPERKSPRDDSDDRNRQPPKPDGI